MDLRETSTLVGLTITKVIQSCVGGEWLIVSSCGRYMLLCPHYDHYDETSRIETKPLNILEFGGYKLVEEELISQGEYERLQKEYSKNCQQDKLDRERIQYLNLKKKFESGYNVDQV